MSGLQYLSSAQQNASERRHRFREIPLETENRNLHDASAEAANTSKRGQAEDSRHTHIWQRLLLW